MAVAAARIEPVPVTIPYAPAPHRFGELTLPAGPARGVVVVVHGGFWQHAYDLSLGRPLAADLAAGGFATWNIEYRRVGGGGGWPMTFDDVAAAVDALAGPVQAAAHGRLPLDRVVALGHSAGGQLAAWLAARPGLPAGAPGAAPRVALRGAVSQAGVLDLVDAAEQGLGEYAVVDLLGGPPGAVPDRYALASPIARVPIGVPVLGVHGSADDRVPVRQTERFAAASGDRWTRLPGVDHFAVIDPRTPAWRACRAAVEELLT